MLARLAGRLVALRWRRAVGPSCGLDADALARPFLRFTFILSLRNGICGTAGLSVPCPRTSTTLAKQQRRCSKWQGLPLIPLLLLGLLKLPPFSRTKLESYSRKRLYELQTCSPSENHQRGGLTGSRCCRVVVLASRNGAAHEGLAMFASCPDAEIWPSAHLLLQ